MKKTIKSKFGIVFLVAMLSFTVVGTAQITLQNNTIMTIGMDYNVGITNDWNMSDIILTSSVASGTNANWSYTNLNSILNINLKVVSPSNAPYGTNLPGNKVLLMNDGTLDSTYLTGTTTTLVDNGHIGPSGGKLPYLPGETLLKFPATYGQTHVGTYTRNTKFYVGTPLGTPFVVDSIRRNTTVNYDYVIDGWGTLQTPTGSFQVLRQNLYKVTTDSSDYLRQDTQEWIIGAEVSTISERFFIFWSANQSYPVLQLRDIGDGGIINDVFWISNPTLGNNDYTVSDFAIYPNPADDQLIISINDFDKTMISVYDMTGRKLISEKINQSETALSLGNLSSGQYIVSIEKDGKFATQKFIKR
jgi:hypothetical protein